MPSRSYWTCPKPEYTQEFLLASGLPWWDLGELLWVQGSHWISSPAPQIKVPVSTFFADSYPLVWVTFFGWLSEGNRLMKRNRSRSTWGCTTGAPQVINQSIRVRFPGGPLFGSGNSPTSLRYVLFKACRVFTSYYLYFITDNTANGLFLRDPLRFRSYGCFIWALC